MSLSTWSDALSRPALLLAGLALHTEALLAGAGTYSPTSLALMTVASILLAGAFLAPRAERGQGHRWILLLIFLWHLVWYGSYVPGVQLAEFHQGAFGAIAIAVGLAATLCVLGKLQPRILVVLIAVGALLGGAYLLSIAAHVRIDVWQYLQESAQVLGRGENPYAHTFKDVYAGQDLTDDVMRVETLPYPPQQVWLSSLAYLLTGEIRWGSLFMLIAAGVGVYRLARLRCPDPADPTPALLAGLVILHPRSLLVIEMAWTEPYILASLAWAFYAQATGRKILAGVAFGVTLGLKQHLILLVPALLLLRPDRRQVAAAATTILVVALPFLCWAPAEFLRDLVSHGRIAVFEISLSFAVPLVQETGFSVPVWLAVLVAAVVASLHMWRGERSLAGAALAAGSTFQVLFLIAPRAHLNYYIMTAGFFILAYGAPASEPEDSANTPPEPEDGGALENKAITLP